MSFSCALDRVARYGEPGDAGGPSGANEASTEVRVFLHICFTVTCVLPPLLFIVRAPCEIPCFCCSPRRVNMLLPVFLPTPLCAFLLVMLLLMMNVPSNSGFRVWSETCVFFTTTHCPGAFSSAYVWIYMWAPWRMCMHGTGIHMKTPHS